jgi:TonB-linked SusC/RagA family outer membrane protein
MTHTTNILKILLNGVMLLCITVFAANAQEDAPLTYLNEPQAAQAAQDAITIDSVTLSFTSIHKRRSASNAVVVSGNALEVSTSSDIRNSLTGLVSGLEILEQHGAPGMNAREGSSVRKTSVLLRGKMPLYIVDGMPVNIAETPLDPQEVESVTILKDAVDKAFYGLTAADGVVYIKTKSGRYNSYGLNVNVEAGVSVIDRMPQWVNGADYALMNNIARSNSGLGMLYTQADVQQFSLNNPYNYFYPNVDYRDMLVKSTMNYQRINVSGSGGNDNMKYHAYIGYTGEGDIFKIGSTANYDRLNFGSNIDVKLNHFISAHLGIFSNISYRRSPNYGNGVYEFPTMLQDINKIPAIEFPIHPYNIDDPDAYAVSENFTYNPVAKLLKGGNYTETTRKGLINASVDMDLSFILEGLTATTYGAFDGTNLIRLGTTEDYNAYTKPALANMINSLVGMDGITVYDTLAWQKNSAHDVNNATQKSKLVDYQLYRFYGSQQIAYDNSFGLHSVGASATAFITKSMYTGLGLDPRREITGVFAARYAYNNRYLLQFASNYGGTFALMGNRRAAFSPAAGAGWVVTEESFMKDIKQINFLKVNVQGGVLNRYEDFSAYWDIDNYTYSSNNGQNFGPYTGNPAYLWFGNEQSGATSTTYLSRIGNPNLRLERIREISAGIEGVAFDRLSFELNGYTKLSDGTAVNGNVSTNDNLVPLVVGVSDADLYLNYRQTRYYGMELAVGFHDKVNEFSYSVNANATLQNSKVLRADELNYPYAYRSQVGYPNEGIFGLRYDGQFATNEETTLIPQMYNADLTAGDFRYVDMNNDGMVDDNDRCYIGNRSPKLFYGLQINLRYKDFDLTVTGSGRAFYYIDLTASTYYMGWSGADYAKSNYSMYARQNLGNANAPRLTSDKINNNYQLSDYWIVEGSYFKIQNLEIGYNLPLRKWFGGKADFGCRLYVRGSNLLTLSKVKDIDPESLNSGVSAYPLFKSFVGGLKVTF